MADKIYIRNEAGELHPAEEKEFETEDSLQQLIARHPELLAGDRMRPDNPLRWMLVQREMPIEGWAVDLLLMDQHSYPTLVEVKRGDNREGRRAVVGQMLDYASAAADAWSGDTMRVAFERDAEYRGSDPYEELRALLGLAPDTDIEEAANAFWERAAANLEAGRMSLLFVSDKIPVELERSVTFWNVQTKDSIEVLAVEVKQYPGQFGDALVSRVIGQSMGSQPITARVQRAGMPLSDFLDAFPNDVRDAAYGLIENVQSNGAVIESRPGGVTVGTRCPAYGNRVTNVAQFYAPTDVDEGYFAFRIYFDHPHSGVQELLREWIRQFEDNDFGTPYSYQGWMPGRSISPKELIEQSSTLSDRLNSVMDQLRGLPLTDPC